LERAAHSGRFDRVLRCQCDLRNLLGIADDINTVNVDCGTPFVMMEELRRSKQEE
jgi:hypothetical protein